jgi:hypothetical protein
VSETPQQVPDESGKIPGGQALVDAVTKTWAQGLTAPSTEDEGPLWVDPDLPVWGNIDPNEVS